jgi:hypothetical protein
MSQPNLITSDNVGNYYMGFRSDLFAYDTRISGGNNAPNLRDLINQLGSGLAVSNSTISISFKLPQAFDTSNNPTTTLNGRFRENLLYTSNTSSLSSALFYQVPGGGSEFNLSNAGAWYFVVNSFSVSMFRSNVSGNALDNSNYFFRQVGWAKNPLYTGTNYPLNAYYYFLNSSSNSRGGGRPTLPNIDTRTALRVPTGTSADSIANYSITCQTSTPGANTTDLVLRDDASPNRAIGVASNLLKTSLAIPVGQIYRNTGVDPDGSDNPFWICVGVMGSERILMRVRTLNLT